MGPSASESVPLSLCSPTFLLLQSSRNSPFLPFLLHSCEEHKHSEHCERPSSTTSLASNPKYISTLTASVSKHSFTVSPLLRGEVSVPELGPCTDHVVQAGTCICYGSFGTYPLQSKCILYDAYTCQHFTLPPPPPCIS